jgi:RNA polymerase sigma-70 factor, ECF subfamily
MTDRVEPKTSPNAATNDATETDDQIIHAAINGDRRAFAALFDRHYDLIYRVALKYTRKPADAEDIAQETSVKLARKLQTYRFESKFTTWLYRLTLNTAKDWQRKACHKYEKSWPEGFDVPAAATSPERHVIAREALGAVEALPKKLKAAVLLVFRDGLSHSQAALALGCAETTISWRIHEARKTLATQDEQEDLGNNHA